MQYQRLFYFIKLIFFLTILSLSFTVADINTASPKEQKEKTLKLPPCKACTVLADSFKLGLEKTSRGKHAGGDAAWEEEKLRSYKTSEVRLVEIQEQLCIDVKRGQDQCHSLANDHENLLEDWFTNYQTKSPDVQAWLCIEQLKECCPAGHYGPECTKCSGCHGNGKCKGDGTRKGNGKCKCDNGYKGADCNECEFNYYEAYRDDSKLLCSVCHKACGKGGCTGAGPKSCKDCKEGYSMSKENGCLDVNECLELAHPCAKNQFCVNNDGDHACLECDRSCDSCDGDGPDMCKKCAAGFTLKDGKCEDDAIGHRENFVSVTRFLTYLGMCIATFVIFQNSSHISYIVGAAVAIYIAASEYWLNSSLSRSGEIDTKELEAAIMKSLQ